jgi:hypothetical protein
MGPKLGGEHILTEIDKLRVLATYGKKRHFNAADRKRRWHHFLTYSVLILNIITGSVLFTIMKEQLWEHLPAVFAMMSALIIGTSEYFNFGKDAHEHSSIADRYLRLTRDCAVIIAKHKAGIIPDDRLDHHRGELQATISEIDTSAIAYPTNNADYKRSRQGVRDGEERFTPVELNDKE